MTFLEVVTLQSDLKLPMLVPPIPYQKTEVQVKETTKTDFVGGYLTSKELSVRLRLNNLKLTEESRGLLLEISDTYIELINALQGTPLIINKDYVEDVLKEDAARIKEETDKDLTFLETYNYKKHNLVEDRIKNFELRLFL